MARIRQERTGHTLVAGLGLAWVPGTAICDATEGRGMLVAMDAMGYDAFHIGPADPLYTQPAKVEAPRHVVQTPLAAGPWWGTSTRKGLVFRLAAIPHVGPANAELPDLTMALQLCKFPRAAVDADRD